MLSQTKGIRILLNFYLYCPVNQGKEVEILNRLRLSRSLVKGLEYVIVNGEQYFNIYGIASPQILLELSKIEGLLVNERPRR